MGLSGSDRARYARQLLLSQLGERGQERLLAAELRPARGADSGALEVARVYLERAGVRVLKHVEARRSAREQDDVDARRSAREPVPDAPELALYAPAEIARMAGDEGLAEAARALAGALAAVAAIRKIVDLPGPSEQLPVVPLSSIADAREQCAGAREQRQDA